MQKNNKKGKAINIKVLTVFGKFHIIIYQHKDNQLIKLKHYLQTVSIFSLVFVYEKHFRITVSLLLGVNGTDTGFSH